jgi:4-hydroxyphenylpyruvate dioxygenase
MPENKISLKGFDHLEFYVGNAKQSAVYYQYALGFKLTAYAGLETGIKDKTSYLLSQGKINFVLSTPMNSDSIISEHIKKHGDGVRDIAFLVDDSAGCFEEALKLGAEPVLQPEKTEDKDGFIIRSAIKTYGDTIHSFIQRDNYHGLFMPGFMSAEHKAVDGIKETGLKVIDHIVGNVYEGEMNKFAGYYRNVLGFERLISFDDKDISTEYTALQSIVMQNHSGKVKFPINEPAKGKKKSQIEEYLDFYESQGVQHIAMATNNIIETVGDLKKRGVDFLTVPETYYEDVKSRVGEIRENISELAKLGILIDRDEYGYLLQIFSKPVQDRPTLFFEVIQRRGAKSFGKGNFKALFEAIEREQEKRGTL